MKDAEEIAAAAASADADGRFVTQVKAAVAAAASAAAYDESRVPVATASRPDLAAPAVEAAVASAAANETYAAAPRLRPVPRLHRA